MASRRLVVTGRTGDGSSAVLSDTAVEPIEVAMLPGRQFHILWSSDLPPTLRQPGSADPPSRYFPPPGGCRFVLFTVPPEPSPPPPGLDRAAGLEEFRRRLPGVQEAMEPDRPGMHATESVDFDLVLSGEVILELPDGREVRLGPGDSAVLSGTRHAWRNRGRVPCVMLNALLGAAPD
jgi:hypothetical protein